jgi:hypothetical protein
MDTDRDLDLGVDLDQLREQGVQLARTALNRHLPARIRTLARWGVMNALQAAGPTPEDGAPDLREFHALSAMERFARLRPIIFRSAGGTQLHRRPTCTARSTRPRQRRARTRRTSSRAGPDDSSDGPGGAGPARPHIDLARGAV